MTIALGILATDGVVLAADTEETMHGGLWKVDHGKLAAAIASSRSEQGASGCLVSGAGSGGYIDTIGDQLREALKSNPALEADVLIRDHFSGILARFYEQHVLPFASYPSEDRPEFALLIGYEIHGATGLLVSELNLFVKRGPFAAVGMGGAVATTLLTRFFKLPSPDIQQAILLAAYVMYHVKESIPSCGKQTDIWGLKRGAFFRLHRKQTALLESAIEDYSYNVEPTELYEVLGLDTGPSKEAARGARNGLKKAMAALSSLR